MSDSTSRDAVRSEPRIAGSAERRSRRSLKFRGSLESLEGRALLTASLAPIPDANVPQFLGFQVPLNGSAAGVNQTYSVSSDNTRIKASVAQGQFLNLAITHASSGVNDPAFSGTIVFQLFEDVTPLTTSKIEQLVTSNFYNGKNIHRIAGNFPGTTDYIIQGGSVDGAGHDNPPAAGQPGGLPSTGFPFYDEFTASTAFTGTYQLAMANAGADTNTSQWFITTGSPQFLNFKHTVFGQVVSGFDIVNKLTQVPVDSNNAPLGSTIINTATLTNANPNGVVHIDATAANADEVGHVTVTATDPSTNTTATQTFTVTATPYDPAKDSRAFLVSYPQNTTVAKNQKAVFKITGTGPEPNNTLTYTVQGGVSGSTFTPVQNGTASVTSDGIVTVTPTAGFSGTINLLVGVRDQTDRSGTGNLDNPSNFDTQVITVTVNSDTTEINLAPIALPITQVVKTNTSVPIQLLGNTANPASGQTLSYQLTSQAIHGTLTGPNQATGVVTYTPNPGFTGPDTFTYKVTDVGAPTPNLSSPEVTVQINVTQGSTEAVRTIGKVLVVTPPPRRGDVTNTISVKNVAGTLQVTVNGIVDSTQPSASNIDLIVVYGSKANDNISIDSSVKIQTTLDGGHGGKNNVSAGPANSLLHGWFGSNKLTGGSQMNTLYGRKGHVQFIKSTGTDAPMAIIQPNFLTKGGHQHRQRRPPRVTFLKWVGHKLVAIKTPPAIPAQQDPQPPIQ